MLIDVHGHPGRMSPGRREFIAATNLIAKMNARRSERGCVPRACLGGVLLLAMSAGAAGVPLPPLPETSGEVAIPAQDAAGMTGRTVMVYLRYPEGRLDAVKPTTGLMLSLHNWGGTRFTGAPTPETMAKRYDVVAIGVDYLQSADKPTDPVPYDFGCFQACDALRALHYVFRSLGDRRVAFDRTRIYTAGGSGGGNVSLMAAKFAPGTFACVVDLSGMASLTDDIAYNLPGGSSLNARYSRDPASHAYLSPGMQELRDPGNPAHLTLPGVPRNAATFVCVHGRDDTYCLWEDKDRVVNAMRKAGLDVTLHTIRKEDINGTTIRDSGHSIGNRTELAERFAGQYLTPGSPDLRRLQDSTDFERCSVLEFPVSDGAWVVSFANGWPELTFTSGKLLLEPIGDKTVPEGTPLTFAAVATDTHLPANALRFSLDAGTPAGAAIDPVTGAFSWTPSEADGPNTYPITVRVTDNGTPALDDAETITVTVTEVNVAPVLEPIGDKTVAEGTPLTFAAVATDADLPANALRFSLDAGAPAGAAIDPRTGVFSWIPREGDGPNTYPITVRVTDNGTPALDDAETIAVVRFDLAANWNLISLPLRPDLPVMDRVPAAPTREGAGSTGLVFWRWDTEAKEYRQLERFESLTGYWIFAPAPTRVWVTLAALTNATVRLRAGWNLVGVAAESAVPTTPPLLTPVWGWDATTARYTDTARMLPGKGYWLHASEPCTVELGGR